MSCTPELDEEFLRLVCADEVLLRAEFDEILGNEWEAVRRLPPRPPNRLLTPPSRRRSSLPQPRSVLGWAAHRRPRAGNWTLKERAPPTR